MAEVENWDDDADFQGDLFANSSVSTALTNPSSRVSARSESNVGDEDWHVAISPDDEASKSNAISSAKQVGIPIPPNVPASALLGGTIKRLGKQKSRPNVADDWGDDFEPAESGFSPGLNLKLRSDPPPADSLNLPKTPATDQEEFDSEWAEGSLGIRHGGTRRDTRNRSSSVSAMSPSLGSCMTLESEEDDLGGLVLPSAPIDFTRLLQKRKDMDFDAPTSAPALQPLSKPEEPPARPAVQPEDDDMSAGLDVGGDVFDPKKRNVNRNIKFSFPQKASGPANRNAMTSITFTDKPGTSRIPRPSPSIKNFKLDTVPESAMSHQQQTPSHHQQQQTPSSAARVLRPAPTTTSAQLLRSKRSAPVLGSRQPAAGRPLVPFLPAGAATSQSHHVSVKSGPFHFRQPSDGNDRPMSPPSRAFSRLSVAQNENTPSRAGHRKEHTAVSLLRHAASQRILQPKKPRTFGDGSELERFDDLPTSVTKEIKFTKEPANRVVNPTVPKTLKRQQSRRNLAEIATSHIPTSITPSAASTVSTPLAPPTPRSYFPPPKAADNTPRFARDTAASRIAREQRLGTNHRTRGSGPVEPVPVNWKAQIAARTPQTSPSAQRTKKRGEGKQPHLISQMGAVVTKSKWFFLYTQKTRISTNIQSQTKRAWCIIRNCSAGKAMSTP
jgi:hypothetical protein